MGYSTSGGMFDHIFVSALRMKVGDLAQVHASESYANHFILKVYDAIISITDPDCTWKADADFRVRILQPGEWITLKVKEKS